jgi:hypothetical protein
MILDTLTRNYLNLLKHDGSCIYQCALKFKVGFSVRSCVWFRNTSLSNLSLLITYTNRIMCGFQRISRKLGVVGVLPQLHRDYLLKLLSNYSFPCVSVPYVVTCWQRRNMHHKESQKFHLRPVFVRYSLFSKKLVFVLKTFDILSFVIEKQAFSLN